jgi:hypothetical protein
MRRFCPLRNPECGRDSCRLCQEPNHVPLRCEEVEKKDEEEERKKIEEQLSEAMMRECWRCKVKYFKKDGCNLITRQPQPPILIFFNLILSREVQMKIFTSSGLRLIVYLNERHVKFDKFVTLSVELWRCHLRRVPVSLIKI